MPCVPVPPLNTAAAGDLFTQMTELAVSVPFVMSHRLTRLALAGPNPSARDRQEFMSMGWEKVVACQQSWLAMTGASMGISQDLMANSLRWWVAPWSPASADRAMQVIHQAPMKVASAGLKPVSRRAGANARRLSRISARP
ncbi:MAG: hypothetical protein RLZZ592_540 [Pseudomonadota bacterium]|jgi:hypothetical protein|nr:hypothetical protein [Pseudomonadota bacterium]